MPRKITYSLNESLPELYGDGDDRDERVQGIEQG